MTHKHYVNHISILLATSLFMWVRWHHGPKIKMGLKLNDQNENFQNIMIKMKIPP